MPIGDDGSPKSLPSISVATNGARREGRTVVCARPRDAGARGTAARGDAVAWAMGRVGAPARRPWDAPGPADPAGTDDPELADVHGRGSGGGHPAVVHQHGTPSPGHQSQVGHPPGPGGPCLDGGARATGRRSARGRARGRAIPTGDVGGGRPVRGARLDDSPALTPARGKVAGPRRARGPADGSPGCADRPPRRPPGSRPPPRRAGYPPDSREPPRRGGAPVGPCRPGPRPHSRRDGKRRGSAPTARRHR